MKKRTHSPQSYILTDNNNNNNKMMTGSAALLPKTKKNKTQQQTKPTPHKIFEINTAHSKTKKTII